MNTGLVYTTGETKKSSALVMKEVVRAFYIAVTMS